jgi:predicted alpha/beta-fold hydrolase
MYYTSSKAYYQHNTKNKTLIEKLGDLVFVPTFLLPNFFMQCAYNELMPKPIIKYKREYLTTEDSGLISLDWVVKENDSYNKILVILHGITGGSNSCYIRDTIAGFMNTSYKIVVVQYRGVNDTPLLTPQMFHGGLTDDLLFAMRNIRSRYNTLPCYCIGQSMGANVFTKFLAQHSAEFKDYVKGFVSISNPFDYNEIVKLNIGTWVEYFMVLVRQKSIKPLKSFLRLNSSI